MQSNISIAEKEIEVAKRLFVDGYLPGPIKCSCGETNFNINNDSSNHTSLCCFRCSNYKYRKKYSIRINSFYSLFSFTLLRIVSELISCFICKEYNVEKALKYVAGSLNYNISNKLIYKIYREMRIIIHKYMRFVYETEIFAKENANGFYSIDESLIGHKNGNQLWLFGAINNISKEFRIEVCFERNTDTMKKFIEKYIPIGNTIITDGFPSYNFLDQEGSGYNHIKHIHGGGDFGFGVESTSHIESIWSQIKGRIKSNYYSVPQKNLMLFIREIREAEYKIKLKYKSNSEKIRDFFECYKFLSDVNDVKLEKNIFFDESVSEDSDDD